MVACARCGETNPDRARFCLRCGAPLGNSVAAGRDVRKIVTVLFCDLTGSTALGERLDPESLRLVVSSYFEAMRRVIDRHGGTVEKFIGDAVMAVFGVPETREGDAVRALAAAVEMQSALDLLNGDLRARWGVELQARIGVNTGEVIAGDAGVGQGMVAGDVVNVAARLEQAAAPGEILIGGLTHQLARDAISAEPVPALHMKGKREAVPAYHLLRVAPLAPGRVRRLDIPLVGRERDLRVLTNAYGRTVATATCQRVTVVGEPGVGKSRLAAAAVSALEATATVLMASCPEYGEGMTFWPVADVVRKAARLSVSDSRATAVAQLEGVMRAEPDAGTIAGHLAQLLGLGGATVPVDELAWAVRRLFERLSQDAPLLVVFEDLHWAEPAFLDLIDHLVARIRQAPVLLVCVGRPELLDERPAWEGDGTASFAVHVQPLSDDEVALLVDRLLVGHSLAGAAGAWVTQAAEGNPLFVEETLAMLMEEGYLTQRQGTWVPATALANLPMPPTLASLLTARIDQLGGHDAAPLERASVVGRVFSTGALAALTPAPDRSDLRTSIERLTHRDLVHPEPGGFLDGDAYAFRHALIRDAAYGMLPKMERAELHEKLAGWLQDATGGWAVEYEELEAYHLEAAVRFRAELGITDDHGHDLAARAAGMLVSAGRRALAREDAAAAVGLLSRGSALLASEDLRRAGALHDLGTALMASGRLTEAAGALDQARAAAATSHDRREGLEVGISLLRLRMHTDPGTTIDQASDEARQAIAEFDRLGDQAGLSRAWQLVATIEWNRCHVRASEEALERAVDHARAAGDAEEEAANLGNLTGVAFFGPMPVEAGIRRCEEALAAAGGRRMLEARALRALAGMRAMQGDVGEAREHIARSLAIFEDLGQTQFTAAALQILGIVERLAGQPAAAEDALRRSYDLLDAAGDTAHRSSAAALLADALYDLGRDDEAEGFTIVCEEIGAAEDLATQMRWRATRAKILARRGAQAEALSLVHEAERIGRRSELYVFADVLTDAARVLAAAGRMDEATAAVDEAIALAARKGDTVSAARAQALRSMMQPLDPP